MQTAMLVKEMGGYQNRSDSGTEVGVTQSGRENNSKQNRTEHYKGQKKKVLQSCTDAVHKESVGCRQRDVICSAFLLRNVLY